MIFGRIVEKQFGYKMLYLFIFGGIFSNILSNLIKINKGKYKSEFSNLLKKIRAKSNEEISLDEITKEVEQVRKSRYEK
mgnify:CR=1 FL=1